MDKVAAWDIREYEIEKKLGEGSFAVVYLAHQKSLGRLVAIKSLGAVLANDPEFIQRFEVEARIIAGLEHPNIVPIYDFWREPDQAYIVMRYMRGGSLFDVMKKKGCMEVQESLQFVQQIGSALAFSHRYGVIHGDIKPENILIDQQAYLGDFGIAQFFKAKQLGWGSPAYAAPEQLNSSNLAPQSDQYMLAVVFYEMLTSQSPFPDLKTHTWRELVANREQKSIPPVTAIRPDLPTQLDAILQKATAPNYQERYTDLDGFLLALQSLYAPLSVKQSSIAAMQEKPLNPYKGLRPYQQSDARYFFGREDLAADMLLRLQKYPFWALIGASGSGKSSVINAGLLPAIRQSSSVNQWHTMTIFPGAHPMSELESALFRSGTVNQQQIHQALWSDHRGLMRAGDLLIQNQLLLIVDQFEEIYTVTQKTEERDHFLAVLYEAATNPHSQVRVLIVLRTDFYDRLLQDAKWSLLLSEHTLIVPMMSALELERAITGPAARAGVSLEDRLVPLLIGEVLERPGSLPILEYTLAELFDHQQNNMLTVEALHQMGGISGALTHRANCVFADADPETQTLIRQIFSRLITLGEGTECTRRRTLQSEIFSLSKDWERSHNIIETFSKYRILTLDYDARTRQPIVEIAHEVLIREWALLKTWTQEYQQAIRLQRFLALAASEWEASSHNPGYLLPEARLLQFQEWEQLSAIQLTPSEYTFLRASRNAQENQQTAERLRREREFRLETRSRNILHQLLLGAAVTIAMLILLSALLLVQRSTIQKQRDDAQAAQQAQEAQAEQAQSFALAAHAQLLKDENMPLARALALSSNAIENPSIFAQLILSEVAYEPGIAAMWRESQGQVLAAAISQDQNYIYTLNNLRTLTVRDIRTGEIVRTQKTNSMYTQQVVFSSTQQYIAEVSSNNNTIILFDLETGHNVRELVGHTAQIASLSFNADDSRLISSSINNEIIIWDVANGKELQLFTPYIYPYRRMILSPDGNWILSSSYDQSVSLWDLTSGDILYNLEVHQGSVGAMVFSPDGHMALTGSNDHSVILWNLDDGTIRQKLDGHQAEITAVAFSPNGQLALSGSRDGMIIVWDLSTGTLLYRFLEPSGMVTGLSFSPDGQIAISYSDYTVALWNIRHGAFISLLNGHHKPVWSLAIRPNGEQAVSGSADGKIMFWDLTENRPLREIQVAELPYALDYSPDGQYIAVGLQDGRVELLDSETGEEIITLRNHLAAIYDVAFSPDGSLLASASQDGTIMLWDSVSRDLVKVFVGHQNPVRSIAFSPDGTLLVSSSQNVMLWDVQTGQNLAIFDAQSNIIYAVAFHPDGQQIVSAAGDGSLILWDIPTGEILYRMLGHTGAVRDVVFSPDGRYIASVSADSTVRVWDTTEGQLLRQYNFHRNGLRRVAIHPSGNYILTGGNDSNVVLWRLDSQEELIEWITSEYHITPLSCDQQLQYNFSNRCY